MLIIKLNILTDVWRAVLYGKHQRLPRRGGGLQPFDERSLKDLFFSLDVWRAVLHGEHQRIPRRGGGLQPFDESWMKDLFSSLDVWRAVLHCEHQRLPRRGGGLQPFADSSMKRYVLLSRRLMRCPQWRTSAATAPWWRPPTILVAFSPVRLPLPAR